MNKSQLIDNFLAHTYRSLREGERFLQDGSSKSYFELFWDTINNAFSTGLKGYRPPNSTVESFYRGTLDVKEFSLQVRETVINKHIDKLDVNCDPLLSISWEQYSFVASRKKLCESIPKLCRRHLWGIFNKLDCDSSGYASLEDVIDVILKIYKVTGMEEAEENIKEWFCEAEKVDFWCFFSALAETHSHLLTPSNLQVVYDVVFYEILKEAKMKKKGHKVANWKERWFVLSTTQLCYYESEENRNLKGTIIINSNSVVDKLPQTKDHPYLFRVNDGKSRVPYDISCSDPQKMNDWIEILQVTIKAHSESGRSTLHKLREAGRKLFPKENHVKPLPKSPVGLSEYNRSPIPKVMPSNMTNMPLPNTPPANADTRTPYSRNDKELPPLPNIPPSVQPLVHDSNMSSTYESIKSGPGPKVQPYKKDSTGSGQPILPQTSTSVPKQFDRPMMPSVSAEQGSDEPFYVNLQRSQGRSEFEDTLDGVSFSLSNTSPIPQQEAGTYPSSITSNTVLPPQQQRDLKTEHDYVNVNHVTVSSGYDYASVSKGKVKTTPTETTPPPNISPPAAVNKPAPVPRKRNLKQTKSLPNTSSPPPPDTNVRQNTSGNLDYPILEFSDGTSNQVADVVVPKPLSYTPPKQQFDYTDVLVDVKDVGTAVQLKGNRPPPTPPSKYTPKPAQQQHTVAVPGMYQNVPSSRMTGQSPIPHTGMSSPPTSPTGNDGSSPPPPPPPRRQSKRPPDNMAPMRQSVPPFEFSPLEGGVFSIDNQYGSITLDHFSLIGTVLNFDNIPVCMDWEPVNEDTTESLNTNTASTSQDVSVQTDSNDDDDVDLLYTGQFYYSLYGDGMTINQWSVKFIAVKDLNALETYLKEKLPSAIDDQPIQFGFHGNNGVLELVMNHVQDTAHSKGWTVLPHKNPLTIQRKLMDKFGRDDGVPSPPFCLVTVYATPGPDTALDLHYCIPLRGVVCDTEEIFINRILQKTRARSVTRVRDIEETNADEPPAKRKKEEPSKPQRYFEGVDTAYALVLPNNDTAVNYYEIFRNHHDDLVTAMAKSCSLSKVARGLKSANLVSQSAVDFVNPTRIESDPDQCVIRLLREIMEFLRISKNSSKKYQAITNFCRVLHDQDSPLLLSEMASLLSDELGIRTSSYQ